MVTVIVGQQWSSLRASAELTATNDRADQWVADRRQRVYIQNNCVINMKLTKLNDTFKIYNVSNNGLAFRAGSVVIQGQWKWRI